MAKTTMLLEVSPEVAEYFERQSAIPDPSRLINKVLRDEIRRRGFSPGQARYNRHDRVLDDYEQGLDRDTPAGG